MRLLEAKLQMLTAYEMMVNKGTWVSWPDGNQYFVIKPEDFRALIEPSERVDEAEEREEQGRRARMPPFFELKRQHTLGAHHRPRSARVVEPFVPHLHFDCPRVEVPKVQQTCVGRSRGWAGRPQSDESSGAVKPLADQREELAHEISDGGSVLFEERVRGDLNGSDGARPLEEPRRIWEIFACDEGDVDLLPGVEMQLGDRSSTEIIDEVEVNPSLTDFRHGVQYELPTETRQERPSRPAASLHTTPGIPAFMDPEIALLQGGAGLDVAGRGYDQFTDEERQAVVKAFPREDNFKVGIIDAFYHGMRHQAHTTFGTFNDDVLAFKDPTFQRIDMCSVILSSSWPG